jgi:transcriptional regulator with XRE-family HTH domain
MSAICRRSLTTRVGRRASVIRRGIGEEIRRLRSDAGISQRGLADAASVDQGVLSRVEAGTVEASLATLVALGGVLGADLSVRFYPTTGPTIRDRHQAAMLAAILSAASPRWKRLVEVPVSRPARGSIDLVLADPASPTIVATEIESDLRRLEQQIRWARDKAASLPSSDAWSFLVGGRRQVTPDVERLLVLRSTSRTRQLARQFEEVFRAAYPARTVEVVASIMGESPWPGHGIVWCRVEAGHAEILSGPPRGVSLGR